MLFRHIFQRFVFAVFLAFLFALAVSSIGCAPAEQPGGWDRYMAEHPSERDAGTGEEIVTFKGALVTGQSAPPAGGWASVGAQGWLCAPSSWDPFDNVAGSAAWPAHGWCQWSPASGFSPWRVRPCDSAPPWNGTMQIFTGANYTGSCAQLYGDDVNANNMNGGYVFNSDLTQVSGWYNHWTDGSGTHDTRIRSIKVAAHTNVVLCEGPLQNAWNSCLQYHSISLSTTTTQINYPSLTLSDGVTLFNAAGIQLGYTQP